MNTAENLISICRAQGITLNVNGDALQMLPENKISASLKAALLENQAGILAELTRTDEPVAIQDVEPATMSRLDVFELMEYCKELGARFYLNGGKLQVRGIERLPFDTRLQVLENWWKIHYHLSPPPCGRAPATRDMPLSDSIR